MGYKDITKVPWRSISWSAGPGYVTRNVGGHVPITQGTICKFLSTPCPQGATRATQHMWGLLLPKATSKRLSAHAPGPQVQTTECFLISPCLVLAKHP